MQFSVGILCCIKLSTLPNKEIVGWWLVPSNQAWKYCWNLEWWLSSLFRCLVWLAGGFVRALWVSLRAPRNSSLPLLSHGWWKALRGDREFFKSVMWKCGICSKGSLDLGLSLVLGGSWLVYVPYSVGGLLSSSSELSSGRNSGLKKRTKKGVGGGGGRRRGET